MTQPISITFWNRIEPSPRSESLLPGLTAAVRDPLWFLTRQWQLGEFQGEDAASPAFISVAVRAGQLDGWQAGDATIESYGGAGPLEALAEREPSTPDLRTAVELGQALERRLTASSLPGTVVDSLRQAFPIRAELGPEQARDPSVVRFLRVCAGRATDGIAALTAARAAAPAIPAELVLPAGVAAGTVAAVLAWFTDWAQTTFGPIGRSDPAAWRADRLEYALRAVGAAPGGERVTFDASPGRHGEFDWYSFDEVNREPAADGVAGTEPESFSLLPMPVRFSGMPDPRWWNFEDARFNWSDVDIDRRDLGRMLVVDFMLVQGTDWYLIPLGHEVGGLVAVEQLLVRDVFGGCTLVGRADAAPAEGQGRWSMFSTRGPGQGVAEYFILPPSGLRATVDGPALEEVRFVRDEQANLVWAVETTTEDGTGRPRPGRERAIDARSDAPEPEPTDAALRYRLQTSVPINWIPFVPVQIDAARRAIALQRGAMQQYVDGALTTIRPAGRVLNPTGLAAPGRYLVQEEEVPRTGTRVVRGAHRTRWIDGSTHLWTARRRQAGYGEATSGLRYDIADR